MLLLLETGLHPAMLIYGESTTNNPTNSTNPTTTNSPMLK
jgi:hypothetical protein